MKGYDLVIGGKRIGIKIADVDESDKMKTKVEETMRRMEIFTLPGIVKRSRCAAVAFCKILVPVDRLKSTSIHTVARPEQK